MASIVRSERRTTSADLTPQSPASRCASRLGADGIKTLGAAISGDASAWASDLLCRLVAHHTRAENEAAERGLAAELADEFAPPPRDLEDTLIYCDMTTGPDGQHMPVSQRLADIFDRYEPATPCTALSPGQPPS